jgi:nitrite reductase (NADH) large subunit
MTKEITLVGNNGAWEIYVGGNVGHVIKRGELLTVTKKNDEVKQFIRGFIQYYRETGNYLEPVYEWINRVGMIHIREVLFETSLCEQLVGRLNEETVASEFVKKI